VSKNTIEAIYKLQDQMSKELKTITKEMDKFQKEANENDKATKKMSASIKGAGGVALGAVAGVLSLGVAMSKLTAYTKDSVGLFAEQEKAERLVEVAFGGGADEIKKFASAMQEVSTVGDETTLKYASFLKTMDLTDSQIKDVLKASIDLSATGLVPMDTAVKGLAQSFTGTAGSLSRYVPNLRTLTKEQLEAGEGVELISKQYDGFAKSIAETASGSVTQLDNRIGDLKETFGEQMTPVIVEFKEAMVLVGDIMADNAEAFKVAGLVVAKTAQTFMLIPQTVDLAIDSLFSFAGEISGILGQIPFLNNETKALLEGFKDVTREDTSGAFENIKDTFSALTGEINSTTTELDSYEKTVSKTVNSTKDLENGSNALLEIQNQMQDKAKDEWEKKQKDKRDLEEKLIKHSIEVSEDEENKKTQNAIKEFETWNGIQQEKNKISEANAIKEGERIEQSKERAIASAQAGLDIMKGISDAIATKKMNNIDATEAREIRAVKTSTMSEKKKNEEIAKIEEKAEKLKYEQALKDWKRSIFMIQVDTMAGMD